MAVVKSLSLVIKMKNLRQQLTEISLEAIEVLQISFLTLITSFRKSGEVDDDDTLPNLDFFTKVRL